MIVDVQHCLKPKRHGLHAQSYRQNIDARSKVFQLPEGHF